MSPPVRALPVLSWMRVNPDRLVLYGLRTPTMSLSDFVGFADRGGHRQSKSPLPALASLDSRSESITHRPLRLFVACRSRTQSAPVERLVETTKHSGGLAACATTDSIGYRYDDTDVERTSTPLPLPRGGPAMTRPFATVNDSPPAPLRRGGLPPPGPGRASTSCPRVPEGIRGLVKLRSSPKGSAVPRWAARRCGAAEAAPWKADATRGDRSPPVLVGVATNQGRRGNHHTSLVCLCHRH